MTLALALLASTPMSAWSHTQSGRVLTAYGSVVASRALPNLALNAPTLAAAVVAQPAVTRHPVLDLLNDLQARGIQLPDNLSTREDADTLIAVAKALPDGTAKQDMMAMAQTILSGHGAGPNSGPGVGLAFDGGRGEAESAEVPVPGRWRALVSRLLPSSVARAVSSWNETPQPVNPGDFEVRVQDLRFVPSTTQLPESTAKVTAADKQIVGQDGALKAIKFGLQMPGRHYNLFVSGPEGSGRESALRHILPDVAEKMAAPNDLVAATNFADRDNPVFLELPAGRGVAFTKEVKKFVAGLKQILPEALNSGVVGAAKKEVEDSVQVAAMQRREAFTAEVKEIRLAGGVFGVEFFATPLGEGRTRVGLSLTHSGTAVDQAKVESMIAAGAFTREQFEAAKTELSQKQGEITEKFQALMQENQNEAMAARERVAQIEKQAVASIISQLGQALTEMLMPESEATAYVKTLLQFAAANHEIFLGKIGSAVEEDAGGRDAPGQKPVDAQDFFVVTALSDNASVVGAPVVWVKNPTYENVFGASDDNRRTILIPGMGLMKGGAPGGPTLKGGAIHKANGGFLVIHVMDALREPGVWQALMAAVRNGEAEIADGGLRGLMMGTGSIHHVPSRVKIVLMGSPILRRLIAQHDSDFALNFQSLAEFEPMLPVSEESVAGYVQFLKTAVVTLAGELKREAMDLTQDAMSALVEHGARLAQSNKKLTAEFGALYGVIREATFGAQEAGHREVRRADVDAALQAKKDREEVYLKRMQEVYEKGIFHVQTAGTAVGQVNGLAVMGPMGFVLRTTGRAFAGKKGVVAIDQGAGMLGPTATKATASIGGALAAEIGGLLMEKVEVHLSYEQTYGGVEGDSASMTQYIAALSALSSVPIKQNLAITGSLDQWLHTQAIGGVNEKIEGFFALSKARGLTGDQGVIIPKMNVADLQLGPEIVQAVREGKFHIYAVENVRQAAELLTGTAYATLIEQVSKGAAAIAKGN